MINRLVFCLFFLFIIDQSESQLKVSMLINRKSYSIPMRTKFILKCSATRFDDLNGGDINKDDQFDDDQPELIVLNNVEQIERLADYFKLDKSRSSSKIKTIGWNKTSLNNFKLNGHFDKKFSRLYEDMYISGKSFYQPNENVTLLNADKPCLLFTSFSKKDESIYSCFYKPKIDSYFTFLFSIDFGYLIGSTDSSIDYKKLKNLNLNNRIPLTEKLIYMTCMFTWPFNQECYLVKQFKLQAEEHDSSDYWSNLSSKDQFRLRSLLKQLIKHCHRVSNGRPYLNDKKPKSGRPTDQDQNSFVKDFLLLLFNDLFVNMFFESVNNVLNVFLNDWISGLFNNFIINSISELFNELISERFVDPFKDLNLFYLIYILLFFFIYFSFKSTENEDRKSKKKKAKIKLNPLDITKDDKLTGNDENNLSNEHDQIEFNIPNDRTSNHNSPNFKFNIATKSLELPSRLPRVSKTEENIKKFRNLYRAKIGKTDLISKQNVNKLDHKLPDELDDIRNILKERKLIDSKEQNLEFKGKESEILQLHEFLFTLPKELENDFVDKPFQLILDPTSSVSNLNESNQQLDNLDELKLESFSDNLLHETVSSVLDIK